MKIKRILSAAAAAAMLVSALPMSSFAEGDPVVKTPEGQMLPFELTAPAEITAAASFYNSSPCAELQWVIDDSMKAFGEMDEDERYYKLGNLGFNELYFQPQIDWSVGSDSDWHCTEDNNIYWLNGGGDENDVHHLGAWAYAYFKDSDPMTTEDFKIFNNLGCASDPEDTEWYGLHDDENDYDGWKDVLKEGQYIAEPDDDEEVYPYIDFDNNRVFVRMRYVAFYYLEDDDSGRHYVTSEWSEPVKVKTSDRKTKDDLPFTLTAPDSVAASLTEQEEGNTVQLAWTKNDSMSEWATRDGDPETHDAVVEEFNELGFSDIWFTPQMDWSIDGTDDWHCTAENDLYWQNDGYDENYTQRLGAWAYTGFLDYADKTTTAWVFRHFGTIYDPAYPDYKDSWWYGNHEGGVDCDGWKDVLKEGQYTVVTDSDGVQHAVLNWDDHKMYVRMRYVVTYYLQDDPQDIGRQTIATEWTEPVQVTAKFEPMTKEELTAPDISDLHMTEEEFNDYPVFACMLNVPEKLAAAITRVEANYEYGGGTVLEIQARAKGETEWVGLQGDIWIKTGEMKFAMQNLYETQQAAAGSSIEVRARYWTSQRGDYEDVYSDWSDIIEFLRITKGDVNGDGKVNMKDLVTLQRWLNGWKITIVEDAAKLNDDDKINMKDYVYLQRLLNGWYD